jgi:cell division protease FtsH
MVTVYGMNEKVGNVSFYDPQTENQFTKPYSEETGKLIDDEVRLLVDKAYQRTKRVLQERRKEVEDLAHALLEKEVLHQQDVELIIGKRPFEEKKVFLDELPAKVASIPSNGEINTTAESESEQVNLS